MPNDNTNGNGGTPAPAQQQTENKQTPPAVTAEELAKRDEHIKQLNAENAERRNENKQLKDQLAKAQPILDGLAKLFGGGDKKDDKPAEGAKPEDIINQRMAQLDAKQKRSLIRNAFTAEVAADVQDIDAAWALVESELKGVTVDLETEKVDKSTIKAKVAALRKEKPWLFKPAQTGITDNKGTQPGGSMPNGNGNPTGGQTAYVQWKALKDAGDIAGAQKFYLANKQAIFATSPESRK